MNKRLKHSIHFFTLASFFVVTGPLLADETTTTDTSTTDTTTTIETTVDTADASTTVGTSSQTEGALSQRYSEFLGSEEQAAEVVSGLRQGTAFSLSSDAETTATQIEPPTGTMGYGNVKLTLSLAESTLKQMGITQPTNEELSAVLVGGEINGQPVEGILAMRAEGMGWGQIAREYDMSVGQLMGKGKVATTLPATTESSAVKSNGYIPSHPPKSTSVGVQSRGNGYISSGKGQGSGIVTANGGSVQQASHGKQNGKAFSGKSANSYASAANKNGYIPGSAAGSSATVSNTAAAGTMGKANGHVNKK
ncbi:hypothetical protein [Sedimenticola sp.]|uniref:hypothetical protein n=1 Tax=Sedimenticola sp. TaxID=1940285 RepID=UPI003D0AE051